MTAALADWFASLRVYLRPRVLAILLLGFASGMPLLLTFSTLSVWLTESGIERGTIGLFALVGVPYALKFLWAPLIDRLPVPLLTRWFGRRRGWILFTQLCLVAAILGLAGSNPSQAPLLTAGWALLVAFASASQDIVIDAYRVEALEEEEYGAGAAVIVTGYRVGMLVAGAGALFIAEYAGWFWAYAAMALMMLVGMATVLLSPEPPDGSTAPEPLPVAALSRLGRLGAALSGVMARDNGAAGRRLTTAVAWLYGAVVAPFADFMRRPGWLLILMFVLFYKFGDSLAGIMANVFYVDIGFSKAEIATVSKLFGLAATLLGGFIGGLMVARLGLFQSLLWAGLLQMLSNLMFAVQAVVGHDLSMLTVTIAAENIAGGMGTAAFVAYLSSLCNVAYTATQYALLSAFMSVARTVLSSPGGFLAEQVNWFFFFSFTTLAAVPGLLLLWVLWRRSGRAVPAPAPAVAPAAGE